MCGSQALINNLYRLSVCSTKLETLVSMWVQNLTCVTHKVIPSLYPRISVRYNVIKSYRSKNSIQYVTK
jgi:hypothetical protein